MITTVDFGLQTSTRRLKPPPKPNKARKISLEILDPPTNLTPRRKCLEQKANEKKETLPNYRENLRKVNNLPPELDNQRKNLNLNEEETWKETQDEEEEGRGKKIIKEDKEGRNRSIPLPQSKAVQRKEAGTSKLTRKVPEITKFLEEKFRKSENSSDSGNKFENLGGKNVRQK